MSEPRHVSPLRPTGAEPSALRRLAVRQVAVLHASSAALITGPTLDERACALEWASDALAGLERTAELHRTCGGDDLVQELQRVFQVPVPGSWVDACVALWLVSQADVLALLEAPTEDRQASADLARARERTAAARAALEEACRASSSARHEARRAARAWLPLSLASLGSEGARRALEQALAREWSRLPAPSTHVSPALREPSSKVTTGRLRTVSGR